MKNKGFTIVELIVVVFVIIILSVILVANYERGGYEIELKQSAQQLIGDLQWARQKTASAQAKCLGLHFETNTSTYILFEDTDNNYQYAPPDVLLERIKLRENISVTELDTGAPESEVDVVFVPPDPSVKINQNKSYTFITLWSQKSNATCSVYIIKTGLVEIR